MRHNFVLSEPQICIQNLYAVTIATTLLEVRIVLLQPR